MPVNVEILKKGDDVINVWSQEKSIYVVIKQKNGEVCIYSISPDENGNMRINKDDALLITFGDGVVRASTAVTADEADDASQKDSSINTVEVITF